MGYYTNHSFIAYHSDMCPIEDLNTYKRIEEILSSFIGKNGAQELMEGYTFEAKWYHHEEEMKKLAAQFPDIIFELEGKGEENGDWWKEFYHGDKFYRSEAKLIPPEDKPLDF